VSLSASVADVDGNGVNDFAAGAHNSDVVFLVRGRPVAEARVTATASVPSIDVADLQGMAVKGIPVTELKKPVSRLGGSITP